jgi:hypothetical protein
MARFAHIKLEPSFQEWLSYAQNAKFEPSIVSFLQDQPGLIEDAKSEFTLPVKVDRRSYERLNRLFEVGTPMELLEQLMLGIIGAERLVAYKLHLQTADKPLTGEQVFSGAHKELVVKWSNPIDIKSSLLSITCDNVFGVFEKAGDLSSEYLDNFMEFLQVIPREVSYPLLKKLLKSENKAFRTFIADKRYEDKVVAIAKDAKGIK